MRYKVLIQKGLGSAHFEIVEADSIAEAERLAGGIVVAMPLGDGFRS